MIWPLFPRRGPVVVRLRLYHSVGRDPNTWVSNCSITEGTVDTRQLLMRVLQLLPDEYQRVIDWCLTALPVVRYYPETLRVVERILAIALEFKAIAEGDYAAGSATFDASILLD